MGISIKNYIKILVIAFMLGLFSIQAHAELILARAPQLSSTVLANIWTPYVEYLSEQTGETIKLRLYPNRESFEKDIALGEVDMIFGNPAYAVVGKLKHGYEPLIRSDKKRLKGIIVVRKESPIQSVKDLKDKSIVFPSRTAFAASLYIRDQLDNVEKISYEEAYVSTHDNVYRGVLVGKYVAGGGIKRTLEREPKELKDKLRIIYETPGVKPHPLVVHPKVSVKLRSAILRATLALNESESGRKMLKKLKLASPVKADYENDYKNLEGLAIKVYDYLL